VVNVIYELVCLLFEFKFGAIIGVHEVQLVLASCINILPPSTKECISNFLGESNFFNFDQVFAKNNNIYQTNKLYDENIFHHESDETNLVA
jgi:hypothetical protein